MSNNYYIHMEVFSNGHTCYVLVGGPYSWEMASHIVNEKEIVRRLANVNDGASYVILPYKRITREQAPA